MYLSTLENDCSSNYGETRDCACAVASNTLKCLCLCLNTLLCPMSDKYCSVIMGTRTSTKL